MESNIIKLEQKMRELEPGKDSKLKEIGNNIQRATDTVKKLEGERRQREVELLESKHRLEEELDRAREEERKKAA